MAIKQPTPPTPPTPPVSPKGDGANQAAGTSDNTNTNANPEAGSKDFGVHITISSPEDKAAKQQTDGGKSNVVTQQGDNGTTSQGGDNTAPSQGVPLQGNPNAQPLTTEVQDDGQRIHIGNNMSPLDNISIWPFVVVFCGAFLIFSFMNMRKKKMSTPSVRQRAPQKKPPEDRGAYQKKNDDDDDNIHGHFEVRI